jgi:hypothetical protein
MRWAWLLTPGALLLGSCTFDDTRTECNVTADCAPAQYCYQNFCLHTPESAESPATDAGKGGNAAQSGAGGTPRAGRSGAAAGTGGKGRAGAGGRSDAAAGSGGAGGDQGAAGAPGSACTAPVKCTVAAEDVERLNGCGDGMRACTMGKLAECIPVRTRSYEVCNGRDDDCDSMIDEAAEVEPCYPSDAKGCTEELPGSIKCIGICKPGKRSCVDGVAGECVGATTPMAKEICEAQTPQDDDCNGSVDDTCKCTNATPLPCYEGDISDLFSGGECKQGTQACVGGVLGLCLNQRKRMPETCGNLGHDDDCNTVVDDIPTLNTTCNVSGLKGVCMTSGKLMCTGTALTCVATVMPKTEVCNGIDDDCDGVVDQPFNTLTDRSHCGACNHACAATEACKTGVCTPMSQPGDDAGT